MENKKRSATMAEESQAMTPEETAASDAATATKRQPLKTFHVEDCHASVWVREALVRGEPQKFYSVSFERAYVDRDGSRKYTKSFNMENLGKIVTLCHQASEWFQTLQK